MDEPFTPLRRRVVQRDSGALMFRLASAVAAVLAAANWLVIALRRSRIRQEITAIELARERRRNGADVIRT